MSRDKYEMMEDRPNVSTQIITGTKVPEPVRDEPVSGGPNDYYLCRVEHPSRINQVSYTAECEDLIDALDLTFSEANIFKELWRTARGRQGCGKPGHKALYGAEKVVHYANRRLTATKRLEDRKVMKELSLKIREPEA